MTETPTAPAAAGDSVEARKYTAEILVEADTVEGLKKALKAAGDKMKDHVEDLDATVARYVVDGAEPPVRPSLWRGGVVEGGAWDVKTTRST